MNSRFIQGLLITGKNHQELVRIIENQQESLRIGKNHQELVRINENQCLDLFENQHESIPDLFENH